MRSCTEHQRDAGPMLGPVSGPRGSVAPTLRPAARAHRAPVETRSTLSSIYNSRPKPPNPSLRPRHEPTPPPRRGAAHALLVSRGHEVEEKVISTQSSLLSTSFIHYYLLSLLSLSMQSCATFVDLPEPAASPAEPRSSRAACSGRACARRPPGTRAVNEMLQKLPTNY